MPSLPAFLPERLKLPNICRQPAPNLRTWMKPRRMVNKMPVKTSTYSSTLFHTKSLAVATTAAN